MAKKIEELIEDVDSQIVNIRTKSLDVSFNELYDMYHRRFDIPFDNQTSLHL